MLKITYSEVEKKKKGDVSRNAFTMPMLRASTLIILDSIVRVRCRRCCQKTRRYTIRRQPRTAHGESRRPARAGLGETSIADIFSFANFEILLHKSGTYLSSVSNSVSHNLKSAKKNTNRRNLSTLHTTETPISYLSKMLGKRKSSAPLPPPKKRRKPVPTIEEIRFDASAREDYLTGFHKRKLQRIKNAKEEAAKKEREERVQARKQVCSSIPKNHHSGWLTKWDL